MPVYAHTLPDKPPPFWEPLAHHAANVTALAASFAAAFRAAPWGAYLGAVHDLGKYSQAFQDYLLATADPDAGEISGTTEGDECEDLLPNQEPTSQFPSSKKVDHATFGAQHAHRTIPDRALADIAAFCIAGHHAGLTDYMPLAPSIRSALAQRLTKKIPPVTLPPNLVLPPIPTMPAMHFATRTLGFQIAFFTRMLFSCLIDADRLATEQFCNPAIAAERSRTPVPIFSLAEQLARHLAEKQASAPSTRVNAIRREVVNLCLVAAAAPRGFFSLNVPTGGGKTLASLAFALHHILHHEKNLAQNSPLRRVVMAIPFTSIIEQTADAYRPALNPLGVTA